MASDLDHDALDERDRRELTALADGKLAGRRRASAEARLERSPGLRRALERQRLAVAALAAIEAPAPAALRARLASPPKAPAKRGLPRLGWAGPAVAGLAAVVVVALIVLGGPGAPSFDEARGLGSLAASEPAPAPSSDQPALLAASVEGVAFPNWREEFGWRASGSRADELGDRTATTVFYASDDREIAYSILSGGPLEPPAGESRTVDGVEFTVVREGDRTTVTWLRDGHTCVLSGSGVDARTLVGLAAWKGEGAVAF